MRAAHVRRWKRIAWSLFAVEVVLAGIATTLGILDADVCAPGWDAPHARADRACALLAETDDLPSLGFVLGFVGFGLVFAFCASLMIGREPGNGVGWSLALIGLGMIAGSTAGAWSVHALMAEPGSLPGGVWMAWVARWTASSPAIFSPFAFFFLFFPTGHFVSRRWKVVAWLAGISGVTLMLLPMFSPGRLLTDPTRSNPAAIEALGRYQSAIDAVAFLMLVVAILAAVVSLGLRFRRARGLERQQLKWMVAAAGVFAVVIMLAPLIFSIPSLSGLWTIILPIALALIPISASIAVLKYRLYEIDLIINRTVVYVVLTVLLAAVYFGVVGLATVTIGGDESPDFIVAAATLTIAGLFNPLRRRIQDRVDHLFYRRRYDAAKAVDAFRSRLREQIDLESVNAEMIDAVQQTVQPIHVSVWLVPATQPQRRA